MNTHMIIPWDKIDKTKTCWNWIGHINSSGYGEYYIKNSKIRAHRFIYELLVGKIPENLVIDHLCKNRKCVNPAHLEPVTNRENIIRGDGISSLNRRKTHCVHGHPFDEKNTAPRKRKNGAMWRVCRECMNQKQREYYKRKHQK